MVECVIMINQSTHMLCADWIKENSLKSRIKWTAKVSKNYKIILLYYPINSLNFSSNTILKIKPNIARFSFSGFLLKFCDLLDFRLHRPANHPRHAPPLRGISTSLLSIIITSHSCYHVYFFFYCCMHGNVLTLFVQ